MYSFSGALTIPGASIYNQPYCQWIGEGSKRGRCRFTCIGHVVYSTMMEIRSAMFTTCLRLAGFFLALAVKFRPQPSESMGVIEAEWLKDECLKT